MRIKRGWFNISRLYREYRCFQWCWCAEHGYWYLFVYCWWFAVEIVGPFEFEVKS
jgi:hypothetical protein